MGFVAADDRAFLGGVNLVSLPAKDGTHVRSARLAFSAILNGLQLSLSALNLSPICVCLQLPIYL